MKVRYLGISDPLELLNGKLYDVVSIEGDWYRIVDETEEDYLYPPQCFDIVEPNDGCTPVMTYEECAARAAKRKAKDEYRKPRTILAHAGFNDRIETPIGSVDVTIDGNPIEFEYLRKFSRYHAAGCTTYLLAAEIPNQKKRQTVECTLSPNGHGTCYEASGQNVVCIEVESEGFMLAIDCSTDDEPESCRLLDYEAECIAYGIRASVPAKSGTQVIVFGVSWIQTDSEEEGAWACIDADPCFIGEAWVDVVDEAEGSSRCPECGTPLSHRVMGSSTGSFCPNCEYGVVTTAYFPMEDDYTTYTVTLDDGNSATKEALSAVNKILGCGFVEAKQIISGGDYGLCTAEAQEALDVIEKLEAAKLSYSVVPPFPYSRIDGCIWNDFDGGASIGEPGSEGGTIVFDAEYRRGARVTVEETSPIPYSITCGVYGLIAHTTFADSEDQAMTKARAIQAELSRALDYPPADEGAWCKDFASRWQ